MSHAPAHFTFKDGTVLHGEYDGTADIMLPMMFETAEQMHAMWRKQEWPKAKCEHAPETVRVRSHYGGGFEWNGSACRACMVYLGPYDYDDFKDIAHQSLPNL